MDPKIIEIIYGAVVAFLVLGVGGIIGLYFRRKQRDHMQSIADSFVDIAISLRQIANRRES